MAVRGVGLTLWVEMEPVSATGPLEASRKRVGAIAQGEGGIRSLADRVR
jgi:hypothetical protein